MKAILDLISRYKDNTEVTKPVEVLPKMPSTSSVSTHFVSGEGIISTGGERQLGIPEITEIYSLPALEAQKKADKLKEKKDLEAEKEKEDIDKHAKNLQKEHDHIIEALNDIVESEKNTPIESVGTLDDKLEKISKSYENWEVRKSYNIKRNCNFTIAQQQTADFIGKSSEERSNLSPFSSRALLAKIERNETRKNEARKASQAIAPKASWTSCFPNPFVKGMTKGPKI